MKPNLPGYQINALIGEGVCGRVWSAEDPMGNEVAVRVLDALAINLEHVREVGQRLDGYVSDDHGPLPIWMQALELKPAMQVMPLIGEEIEGEMVPRNLQVQLDDYLGTERAEDLVKCLAKAMAALHRLQIIHGNLKPGNIFISDEGRVLVGDYGLGWMPGIDFLAFSDALLYMSPEQLADPNGLHDGAGYRWDVFSFGVMAYRLLEGRFPRCHESFEDVAPTAGVLHKEGIEADAQAVADQLREEEVAPWEGEHDEVLKGLVERCLDLKPENRFHDMIELCQFWELETMSIRHNSEMEVVGRKLRKMRNLKQVLTWGIAACLALALGVLATWQARESGLKSERKIAQVAEASALKRLQEAEQIRDDAEGEKFTVEQALVKSEETVTLLDESRRQLLEWALSEGGAGLPVLTGRAGRLQLLDEQYQSLLAESDGVATSPKWRKQWKVERARVALVGQDWKEAREILEGEVTLLGGRGLTTLLLRESNEEEIAPKDLALARKLVQKLTPEEKMWMGSILDLVEVRNLERQGEKDRSLKLLAELGSQISTLPAGEIGTTSLWRTRLHREAAEIADGAGREKLATDFRIELVAELRNELGAADVKGSLRKELTEQFVVSSESLAERIYANGDLETACALSEEALALIPESGSPRVCIAQAVHHAVLAGCARERGEVELARKELELALSLIAGVSTETSHESWRRYRKGMLQWQLAGVCGQEGNHEEEVALATKAHSILRELLAEGGVRPSPIQIHHILGYLCGDLARSFAQAGSPKLAREQLDQAITSWKFLCEGNPTEPEYAAGLAWCEKLRGKS